jgi:hypothetical protein
MTKPVRDEQWVADTFGDVGPAPDNLVEPDPDAPTAPNIERPCEGEVTDDD